MTLQNNLIPIIAKAYRIERGTTEPVEQWRMRVIYSMLGQMAYASLWDVEENEQPVSVVHFKSRMKKLIESYCDIFEYDCITGVPCLKALKLGRTACGAVSG